MKINLLRNDSTEIVWDSDLNEITIRVKRGVVRMLNTDDALSFVLHDIDIMEGWYFGSSLDGKEDQDH